MNLNPWPSSAADFKSEERVRIFVQTLRSRGLSGAPYPKLLLDGLIGARKARQNAAEAQSKGNPRRRDAALARAKTFETYVKNMTPKAAKDLVSVMDRIGVPVPVDVRSLSGGRAVLPPPGSNRTSSSSPKTTPGITAILTGTADAFNLLPPQSLPAPTGDALSQAPPTSDELLVAQAGIQEDQTAQLPEAEAEKITTGLAALTPASVPFWELVDPSEPIARKVVYPALAGIAGAGAAYVLAFPVLPALALGTAVALTVRMFSNSPSPDQETP